MQTDDTDRRLLRQMLATPDTPLPEVAERAGLTASTAARRLDRLKAVGVVEGIERVIDWSALGYTVQVSLRVTLEKGPDRAFEAFQREAREIPEVLEIQTFLGRVDARLSVIARDMAHDQEVYRERILRLPHIADIEALMHVATVKDDRSLPL
ncbi:MAG: Lrp/AsnC family transcriptional regulator [Planctomycetota bacterium]